MKVAFGLPGNSESNRKDTEINLIGLFKHVTPLFVNTNTCKN